MNPRDRDVTCVGERIADRWDDNRDQPFFRITSSLFPISFVYGAGVLLASYDSHCSDD